MRYKLLFQIENMIVHPAYNSTRSQLADLAVLKLEPRTDVGSVQWGNYTSPACLPQQEEETEAAGCQTAGWAVTTQGKGSLRSAVLGHAVSLQAPANCLQGSLSSVEPSQLVCSTSRCNRFVVGPVFCRARGEDRFHVASLPTAGSDWCSAGASTSLAHYAGWLQRTIQYLHPSFASKVTDHSPAAAQELETPTVTEEEQEDNNCTPNPCGDHALCWNGEGRSFLCTCEVRAGSLTVTTLNCNPRLTTPTGTPTAAVWSVCTTTSAAPGRSAGRRGVWWRGGRDNTPSLRTMSRWEGSTTT